MMHSAKVGLVGRTFALAKSNDSGGKKPRIRRSKEERKAMTESFVKMYQNSNDGKFPSLSLTHKEVGGSFYTIREIVREIIQENRVLGPSKLNIDEGNMDKYFEQYPGGPISVEPQDCLSFSSNEPSFPFNGQRSTSEELDNASNEQLIDHQQQILSNDGCSNGVLVNQEYWETSAMKSSGCANVDIPFTYLSSFQELNETLVGLENSVEKQCSDDLVIKKLDENLEEGENTVNIPFSDALINVKVKENLEKVENNVEKPCDDVLSSNKLEENLEGLEYIVDIHAFKITSILPNAIVETFPPKKISKVSRGTIGRSGNTENSTETIEEDETKKGEAHVTSNLLESADLQVDDDDETEIVEAHVTSNLMESANVQVDLSFKISDQIQMVGGTKPKYAPPNCVETKNSSTKDQSISTKATMIESKADVQSTCHSEEGRNSTLNRLKLKSWEGTSMKPSEVDDIPVWSAFKAFVTAFVKFWTD
ncbi:hypothetical protein GIB67_021294 [Kingdonia uniflora]|uniref:AT3G52170-like helix-turn-helix domain-containing protein n=1 Tax=Kingdonia uniflora TaxID=39325 RepID=A0A7J7LY61_9MAGN|nr:hypothetical protein GIB67_021294 [Kingdonia uniflora]